MRSAKLLVKDIPVVAFDEAGNTGANLLDPVQPCFTLASVHLSEDEAREALNPLPVGEANEAHFSKLKRSAAGREGILEVLGSPLLTPETVKLYVVHKPYMVTTKIVDLLIENLAYRDGVDLYNRGGNIALSNLLYYCIPAFCGPERFSQIQESFVGMIRGKTRAAVAEFYKAVEDARHHCSSPKFDSQIALLIATQRILLDHLGEWRHTELDPAVPCLVNISASWSDQFGSAFSIVHDASKPIAFEQDIVEALMDPDGPDIRVGRDRRVMPLFIKATGISLVDSRDVKAVQLADILAGSASSLGIGYTRPQADSGFHEALERAFRKDFIIGAIWPTREVTPAELGTDDAFKAEDELLVGMEIAKRVYIDPSGRPRRRE